MAAWAPPTKVDRTSPRWRRVRQACGTHAASYVDLDAQADLVVATVESFENTTAACPRSSGRAQQAGRRKAI